MYKPLPNQLTIKKSPIEGLGLFATEDIKKNAFVGVTHIRDEQFENKYIRTPVGGFYNHSNEPNVIRMVSDVLPRLKFGDAVDPKKNNIVIPTYNGQQRNPVLFSISMKEKIMTLSGDTGAKKILEKNKNKIFNLKINDEGILKNFNTIKNFDN